mgnify:CR=1 FL=1
MKTRKALLLDVYGATKLEGEKNIMGVGCDYVIIRTAWLYSEFGKNFVKTMLSLTATKPQLNVVFDQAGTPTYAYDLAEAIKGSASTTMLLKHLHLATARQASIISATRAYAHGTTSPRR